MAEFLKEYGPVLIIAAAVIVIVIFIQSDTMQNLFSNTISGLIQKVSQTAIDSVGDGTGGASTGMLLPGALF